MQLKTLKYDRLIIEIENDYCTELGATNTLYISNAKGQCERINISNVDNLELFKENLEEILRHVTTAYNYTKGFNI